MRRALVVALLLLIPASVVGQECHPEYYIYLPVVATTVIPRQGAGSTYNIPFSSSTWCYDWGREPECGRNPVPMLWGAGDVGQPIGDGEWLLGFNEPELEAQANITPTLGAELWRQVETLYPSRKLVSPSASLGWLTQWHAAYVNLYGEPPRVDAVGHHCYGAYDAAYAIAKCKGEAQAVINWAQANSIPEVWATEFAHLPCWPDGDEGTLAFMRAMVEFYDNEPMITRWAWFQVSYRGNEPWAFGPECNTSLVDLDSGEMTVFGIEYESLVQDWW